MTTIGENKVYEYLMSLGFIVTKIPESSQQTPDFLVSDKVSQYVIEVKDKDNQKFIDLIDGKNTYGKVNLEYDNVISGIIREGVSQLDSYDSQEKVFRIIWFFIDTNFFGGSLSLQIGKTLYGLQEIEGYRVNGEFFKTICYYFTFSEFFRNKQLDAVIVQSPTESILCVNDFSAQRDEFRQTRLYQSFVENNLYIIEPSKSRCCVADNFTSLDRKNSKAVADYIGKKYNLREITAYSYNLVSLPIE
ncbi:MAG: hypothetical protein Q8L64_00330 [bacterium]|nr:hypothetical protein [bacterium]